MTDYLAAERSERPAMRLERIQRVSGTMSIACLATAFVVVAGPIVYWTVTSGQDLLKDAGLAGRGLALPEASTRVFAMATTAVPALLLVYALINAYRCFKAFATGEILAHRPANFLWRSSVAVALSVAAQPLAGAALSALLSWNGPPGTKTLSLSVGTETLLPLLFAGMIAVVSWVLREAAFVADENSQFI